MRIICDTNLLVRILTEDDPGQAAQAVELLSAAETIVLPIVVLCELAWNLRKEKRPSRDVARIIRELIDDTRVVVDRELAGHGLALLEHGGDFADGVIAADGRRRMDAPFATFDRKAAKLLEARGVSVTLLG